MEAIRIVVVDDHPVVRQGLRAALRVLPGLDLAGEAADGREAVALVSTVQPDIVLMDLVLPVMDGITATRAIKRSHPNVRVLALTTFSESELVLGALIAGRVGGNDAKTALEALGLADFQPPAKPQGISLGRNRNQRGLRGIVGRHRQRNRAKRRIAEPLDGHREGRSIDV